MQLVGTWESTGLPDRQLVFLEDGTGYISVQTVRHPYFRWWNEQGIAHWQMFSEASLTKWVSSPHAMDCELETSCAFLPAQPSSAVRVAALLVVMLASSAFSAQSVTAAEVSREGQPRWQLQRLDRKSDFHPQRWPKEELEKYVWLQSGSPAARAELKRGLRKTTATQAMIGASSYPLATHIGYKVLQSGGNAADAAIATSLAQIALSAGTSVSYAGIMNVVYYDVATARVYALNAGFNTLKNETDPLSIPRRDPSGRTALVPGYMAGIESFHQRFGSIPFADLIAPAIWIAEQGVPLPREIAQQIQNNRELLARLPETKQIFTNKNGDWYTEGETFRQPALAATLRRVARDGADYMYRGEWARNFVSVVSRNGGKVTMTDLAAYRADWSEPSRISYRDREVVSIGNDHRGALVALASLKAAERARLKQYGHFSSSAESLRYLIQISRIHMGLVSQSAERRASMLPGFDPAIHSQLSEETADRVLARIREGRVEMNGSASSTPHTAPIVVIDAKGNVASLVPTVMMAGWGHTGLFVDGVSIPDTAKFLQPSIARAGPGARLADPTTPILILRNGKPVLAFGSLGGNGLPTLVLQSLVSLLEFDMDVTAAANQPYTLGGYLSGDNDEAARRREVILSGSFSRAVIDKLQALGQPVEIMKESPQEAYWLAIQIDPQTRKITAGASRELPAVFESY